MWVYQSGKVVAKVTVQIAGLTEEELVVVRAEWDNYETPIAPLPPPDSSLFDAAAVNFPQPDPAASPETATCPACVQKREKQPVITTQHTEKWGECVHALRALCVPSL